MLPVILQQTLLTQQTVALYAAGSKYSVFNSFLDKIDCRTKIQQTTCKFCKWPL